SRIADEDEEDDSTDLLSKYGKGLLKGRSAPNSASVVTPTRSEDAEPLLFLSFSFSLFPLLSFFFSSSTPESPFTSFPVLSTINGGHGDPATFHAVSRSDTSFLTAPYTSKKNGSLT